MIYKIQAKHNIQNDVVASFKYVSNLSQNGAYMQDYDWLKTGNKWSDYSHHPNTKINYLEFFDFEIKKKILNNLFFIMGYLNNKIEFTAQGGNYVYSPEGTILRNILGSFNTYAKVIGFKENFSGPYVGLEKSFLINNNLQFKLVARYSNLLMGYYKDKHYLRNPSFLEKAKFRNINFLNTLLELEYVPKDKHRFTLSFEYSKYEQERGNRVRYYDDTSVNLQKTSSIQKNSNILMFNYIYNY